MIEGVGDNGSASPQPGLADVEGLVEDMAGAGLQIVQTSSGHAVELGAGRELAVFRIVQESLTNALKHGRSGTSVTLHLDWSGPGLAVQIASSAAGRSEDSSVTSASGTGRGIPGMRERARLAGGWLTAGPDGKDFRITAFIPYGLAGEGSDAEAAATTGGP